MLPSFCRVTGNSRNLPRPNYFPLLPAISPAEARRMCHPSRAGSDQDLYIPVIEFARVSCSITSKASGTKHHFQPDRLPAGSGAQQCRITAKHRANAQFRYVYPILDAPQLGDRDTEQLKKLLTRIGSGSMKLRAQDQFVYSLEGDQLNLVLPAEMEEAIRKGDIENVSLARSGQVALIRIKDGPSVSLNLRAMDVGGAGELLEGSGQDQATLERQRRVRDYRKHKGSDSLLGFRRRYFQDKENENQLDSCKKEDQDRNQDQDRIQEVDYHGRMDRLSAGRRAAASLLAMGTNWKDLLYPQIQSWDFDSAPAELPGALDINLPEVDPSVNTIDVEDLIPGFLAQDQQDLAHQDLVGFETVPLFETIHPESDQIPEALAEQLETVTGQGLERIDSVFADLESLMILPFVHEVDDVTQALEAGIAGSMIRDSDGVRFVASGSEQSTDVDQDRVQGSLVALADDQRFVVGKTCGKTFLPGRANAGGDQFLSGMTVQTPEGVGFIPGLIFDSGSRKRFSAGEFLDTILGRQFVSGQAVQTLFGPKFLAGKTIRTGQGLKFAAGQTRSCDGSFCSGQVLATADGPQFVAGATYDTPEGARFIAGRITADGEDFVPGQRIGGEFVAGHTLDTPDGPLFVPGLSVQGSERVTFHPGRNIALPDGRIVFVPGETLVAADGSRQFVAGRILETEQGFKFFPCQLDEESQSFLIPARREEDVFRHPILAEALPIDNSTLSALPWKKSDMGYMIQHEDRVKFQVKESVTGDPGRKAVAGRLLEAHHQRVATKFVPGKMIETALGSRFIPGQTVRTNGGESFVPGQVVESGSGAQFFPGQVVETRQGKRFVPGQVFNRRNGPRFVPGKILHTQQGSTFIPGQVVYTDIGSRFIPGQVVDTSTGPYFVPGRVSIKEQGIRFVAGEILETDSGPRYVAQETDDGLQDQEIHVQAFQVSPEELRLITAYPFAALHATEQEELINSRMLRQMAAEGLAVTKHTTGKLHEAVISAPEDRDESILGANVYRETEPVFEVKPVRKISKKDPITAPEAPRIESNVVHIDGMNLGSALKTESVFIEMSDPDQDRLEAEQQLLKEEAVRKEQELRKEQMILKEQQRLQEEKILKEQQLLKEEMILKEQELLKEQAMLKEEMMLRQQEMLNEQERLKQQQILKEQEFKRQQDLLKEETDRKERQIANEKDADKRAALIKEQEELKKQAILQEQQMLEEQEKMRKERILREKRMLEEQETMKEEQILREQQMLEKQEKLKQEQILKEQQLLKEQKILREQQLLKEQQILEEKKLLREQQILKEQEMLKQQKILREQQLLNEQKILKEQQFLNEQQILKEKQLLKEQQILKEQELLKEQQILREQQLVKEQQIQEEQKLLREQQIPKEQATLKQQPILMKQKDNQVKDHHIPEESEEIKMKILLKEHEMQRKQREILEEKDEIKKQILMKELELLMKELEILKETDETKRQILLQERDSLLQQILKLKQTILTDLEISNQSILKEQEMLKQKAILQEQERKEEEKRLTQGQILKQERLTREALLQEQEALEKEREKILQEQALLKEKVRRKEQEAILKEQEQSCRKQALLEKQERLRAEAILKEEREQEKAAQNLLKEQAALKRKEEFLQDQLLRKQEFLKQQAILREQEALKQASIDVGKRARRIVSVSETLNASVLEDLSLGRILSSLFRRIGEDPSVIESDPDVGETLAAALGWAEASGQSKMADKIRYVDIATMNDDPELILHMKNVIRLRSLAGDDPKVLELFEQVIRNPSTLSETQIHHIESLISGSEQTIPAGPGDPTGRDFFAEWNPSRVLFTGKCQLNASGSFHWTEPQRKISGSEGSIYKKPMRGSRRVQSRSSSRLCIPVDLDEEDELILNPAILNQDYLPSCPIPAVITSARDISKSVIDTLRYSSDESRREVYTQKILEAVGCSAPAEEDCTGSRKSSACIILKDFLQTIVPRDAAHSVLTGDIDYMIVDDDGVRYFESASAFASRRNSRYDIRQWQRSCSGSRRNSEDLPNPWADVAPHQSGRRLSIDQFRKRITDSDAEVYAQSGSEERPLRHYSTSFLPNPILRSTSGYSTPAGVRSRRGSFDDVGSFAMGLKRKVGSGSGSVTDHSLAQLRSRMQAFLPDSY